MENVHFAIPEIYGETLSYYELLRKLVDKTNDLIDNYNTVPEQIAEAVSNLDASQLFSAVLNQLIHSIATDNTKSANAVKVYKKHDLLYATFNETVNLYESLIDFSTGTATELIPGTNIREVNISELFIEVRKLIDINKNNIEAVTDVANENSTEITTMHNDITSIENKNTEQDNDISTLRTMISSPYNFKGDVANISALPASGEVNDTYYVQDVKYKVTWTGSAWVQSSLSEADYQTELSELKGDLTNLTETTKNKFTRDIIVSENGFKFENNIISNNLTDTKSYTAIKLYGKKDNVTVETYATNKELTIGNNVFYFNVTQDIDTLVFLHSGSARDLYFTFDVSKFIEHGYNSFSFTAESVNPSVVNGVRLTKVQFENGDQTSFEYPISAYDRNARLNIAENSESIVKLSNEVQKNKQHFKNNLINEFEQLPYAVDIFKNGESSKSNYGNDMTFHNCNK